MVRWTLQAWESTWNWLSKWNLRKARRDWHSMNRHHWHDWNCTRNCSWHHCCCSLCMIINFDFLLFWFIIYNAIMSVWTYSHFHIIHVNPSQGDYESGYYAWISLDNPNRQKVQSNLLEQVTPLGLNVCVGIWLWEVSTYRSLRDPRHCRRQDVVTMPSIWTKQKVDDSLKVWNRYFWKASKMYTITSLTVKINCHLQQPLSLQGKVFKQWKMGDVHHKCATYV